MVFSYTGEHLNLDHLDMKLPVGKSITFVGPSGSGKSTALGLVMRFYDPQAGRVTIDGIDLQTVSLDSLHSHMSVVFQENYLFNASIRENIRLGKPDASDAEVEEAARLAEIHDAILQLPQGYETLAGEAGGRLSGGQRQRIAISRALINDPSLLVLDEATSALDPATESAINETLLSAGRGRTVISVTHRLASARNSDCICVFDHGKLVEQGRHGDLLRARGVYANLWEKQGGFDVSRDGRSAQVAPERLQKMLLFAGLDLHALADLAPQFRSEYFEAGETVLRQGDVGDKLYVIVRGQVEVWVTAPGPGEAMFETQIDTLEDGDHFGEMALLQNRRRTATVKTHSPCLFLTMTTEQLRDLVASHPGVLEPLAARMARSEENLASAAPAVPADIVAV